jgi:hypothetical protein
MLSSTLVTAGHVDANTFRLPAKQGAQDSFLGDSTTPLWINRLVALDSLPARFNDEDANGIGKQPLNLSIEPFPFNADTSDEILERLPFDATNVWTGCQSVVTCRE